MSSMHETSMNRRPISARQVLMVAVPLAIAVLVAVKVTTNQIVAQAQRHSEETMLHWFELSAPTTRGLDAQFTDADNDLVADIPSDAASQESPHRLVFSYVAGPDAEDERATWQDFTALLAQLTEKPVDTVAFHTTNEQLDALTKHELHITGLNTGAVPAAVASAGFVPVCTFGKGDDTFGITMQLIVPAKSELHKIADLKGHTIGFTTRDSNSGCKAALALLRDNELLPFRDYLWKFTGGHEESIKGVAEGRYDVAPVASDLLQRAIAGGIIEAGSVRVLYESEKFPPATLGYVNDLTPELASKIRHAFAEFSPQGTSLEKQFRSTDATKFVPVSYKQDFALIRRIDDAFRKPAAKN
jgi:phosphonate transport system substrate-binding protein